MWFFDPNVVFDTYFLATLKQAKNTSEDFLHVAAGQTKKYTVKSITKLE